jgi:hypothetical protein
MDMCKARRHESIIGTGEQEIAVGAEKHKGGLSWEISFMGV